MLMGEEYNVISRVEITLAEKIKKEYFDEKAKK